MRSPSRAWVIPALVLCTVTGAEAAPPVYATYWGDLHGHSMDSPVNLSPSVVEGYIRYARDTKDLDFVALTEKDFDLSDAEWADCKAAAAAFTASGSFVALSAYEWGDDEYGDFGHRPVYFLTDDQSMVRSDTPTTGQVSEMLDRILADTNGFTSIAHPDLSNHATDWDYFDGASDRVAEIYSRHGHYETGLLGIQQALAQGHRFGFVGVSDTRSATPGSHGLTAILATALSKSNVHAAIKARRCYATSGARILLRATMDGHEMGEEYTSSNGPTLTVNCTPPGTLLSIEVIKNNVVVYTYMPAGFAALAPTEPWKSGPELDGAAWMLPELAPAGFMAAAVDATAKAGSASRFRSTVQLDAVPEHPILMADGVQGEYRLFVNGNLLVDTRTLEHDDHDAPHQCGGEDSHELPGSRALYRRLGFYDLSALGIDLQSGENVIAIECEVGTTAAPDVRLASVPAGAPVSFNWADTNFTGASFYYVRVTQTDGEQAWGSPIWVDRTAPDTTPPLGPTKMRVSKDGNDAYLDWPKVTKDTSGNIENVSFYRVFRGSSPDFTPDLSGFTNQIGTATKSRYRDTGALPGTTNYYYRVTAVDAAGNESAQWSNLGFKVRRLLPFHTAISNLYWISIPYQPMYDTADELVRDLNGGASGPVTKVVRWNVVNQRPECYVYLNGRWMGPNFALVPGQAVAVTVKQSTDAVLVGAHDEGTTVRLTNNPSRPSLNWVCVPVHTPHVLASQLVQDANGGFFPGPVTRITRLNPDTQANQIYQWNGASWSGTNFVLIPGEAYGFEVQSTSDWLPDTRP